MALFCQPVVDFSDTSTATCPAFCELAAQVADA
jgi:hypothetical protein